jgi:hypothetical protein
MDSLLIILNVALVLGFEVLIVVPMLKCYWDRAPCQLVNQNGSYCRGLESSVITPAS